MVDKKTALVLGATGLVGVELVKRLLADSRYAEVTVLVRRPLLGINDPHNKLRIVRLEPQQQAKPWQDYKSAFAVNHVYVCLGTTMKVAGSKLAFKKVDYELVLQAAIMAATQQVDSFVYLSSVDANRKSRSFYLRVKGELESAIAALPTLAYSYPVRPSLLLGKREEFRLLERVTMVMMKWLTGLMIGPLRKYRPIEAKDVALQMIQKQRF